MNPGPTVHAGERGAAGRLVLKPQSGSQWEVGSRTRDLNDRMEATAAVYRILRQNALRRPGGVVCRPARSNPRIRVRLNTSVATNWRLSVGYAYTDAEFLDYEESPGVSASSTPVRAEEHVERLTGYEWKNGLGVNVGARDKLERCSPIRATSSP